ncbi:MAG: serine/threonine protein kinase [Deltaproteobacteria bacterium]|nr:serine/threonine protein kinase [Deltaproteobacteria bacterium]
MESPSVPPDLWHECKARVGKTIDGKYKLVELLGAGTTGAVYRARNEWVARECAVKVFHYEGQHKDSLLQRFIREAQACNRIKKDGRTHPHVVDALDVGRDRETERFFLVQELLQGRTLEAYLDQQPGRRMSVPDAVSVLGPVIDAIACAHEAGIVHRDLKPENVFLVDGPQGELPSAKVLDFGIAQLADARMTRDSELMGTPEYMAPESFFGAKDVDARADVWALAMILYEMVHGASAFYSATDNMFQVMQRISTSEPPSLVEKGLMRPAVWSVLRRALQREAADRYATARALQEALDEVLTTF